ncbi:glycosyltransferase family protein [Tannerella forsythia]|jgi:hypothetical protein|nr:glycosyltransferase family protein [Tannerella forsythia]KKY61766.1 hypothetical protein Tanf_05900 [Tannerella forsythia]OLQ20050.1 hypothetical protein BGK60_01425 [Tannerella forsythia]TPE17591.1 hypothetical protein FJN16_03115 [Tannerella forsythia]
MQKKLRFMFIVQGEGRGHLTQAISLAAMLQRHGHEVAETLVGKSQAREVPDFFRTKIGTPVRSYDAPSFIFKKDRKRLNKFKTVLYNGSPRKLKHYGESIETIYRRIKKVRPDVVVNFYELLPALAQLRFRIDIPFVNIGHQYLLRHPDYGHGKGDAQSLMVLRLHTLLTGIGASKTLALSFYPMKDFPREKIVVVPPLLRREVLELQPSEGDYILGYMLNQGFENEVREWHNAHPETKLHFFWDKRDAPADLVVDEHFTLHRIDDEKFLHYMAGCRGYITTAGFESVCEAFYLNKPVMLIPAHIEQEINAADAASLRGAVVGESFDLNQLIDFMNTSRTFDHDAFRKWLLSAEEIFIRELTSVVG